ncbi:MAG TPA: cystathionine gamma-synthase [Thermoanaerobaculia bacterium]
MNETTLPPASSPGNQLRFATRTVRAGLASDREHGAVVPPIHLTSTFTFDGFDRPRTYDYTRSGNPTRDLLARALADADGGAGAVVTASGMAAVHLVLQLVGSGEVVVAPHDGYGGTYRLLTAASVKGAFDLELADYTDPRQVDAALALRPRLVWLETPSNPLLRITDVAAVCRRARAGGALTAVDNTFLSPALQRPLELGADLVVYSTTKYLNGHSDVVGGAVVAADAALAAELGAWANCLGIAGAPFDSFLTLRGLRTLEARMRVHQENAAALAALLAGHPAVVRVFYPGLPGHPGHALAAAQQHGFGGVVSFELAGTAAVRAFLDGLSVMSLAVSLGGVESLIAHPATMTHASMDAAARRRAGIGDALLRLSVGIEAVDDLIDDVAAGLARAAASSPAVVAA